VGRRTGQKYPRPATGQTERPTSVVEVAAHLHVPVGVARVLVGDPEAFGDQTVRDALALRSDQPLLRTDARDGRSVLATLVALVEHALTRTTAA